MDCRVPGENGLTSTGVILSTALSSVTSARQATISQSGT